MSEKVNRSRSRVDNYLVATPQKLFSELDIPENFPEKEEYNRFYNQIIDNQNLFTQCSWLSGKPVGSP